MNNDNGHWIVFDRDLDGALAIILVDLAPAGEEPDPERPLCIRVAVGFKTAGESGLPEAEEMAVLSRVEEAIQAMLNHRFNARLVGAIACGGERQWVFYGGGLAEAAGEAVEEAVRSINVALEGYEPDCSVSDDPEWEFYNVILLPDQREHRCAMDMAVINALSEAGDRLDHPRPIEHFAYFRSEGAREQFCDWASESGFEISDRLGPDGEGDYGVIFTHTGPALPDSVSAMTLLATQGAERFDGNYDGWECRLCRDDDQ